MFFVFTFALNKKIMTGYNTGAATTGNHSTYITGKANQNMIIGSTTSNNSYLDNMAIGYKEKDILEPKKQDLTTTVILSVSVLLAVLLLLISVKNLYNHLNC